MFRNVETVQPVNLYKLEFSTEELRPDESLKKLEQFTKEHHATGYIIVLPADNKAYYLRGYDSEKKTARAMNYSGHGEPIIEIPVEK